MPPLKPALRSLTKARILKAVAGEDAAILQELSSLISSYMAEGLALKEAGKDPAALLKKAEYPLQKIAASMAVAALTADRNRKR